MNNRPARCVVYFISSLSLPITSLFWLPHIDQACKLNLSNSIWCSVEQRLFRISRLCNLLWVLIIASNSVCRQHVLECLHLNIACFGVSFVSLHLGHKSVVVSKRVNRLDIIGNELVHSLQRKFFILLGICIFHRIFHHFV